MRLFLAILTLLLLQSCATTFPKRHSRIYCNTCARASDGRIQRSNTAKKAFIRQSGYPNGRPGYVVDHKIPLYKGGEDTPENMQWITVEAHKDKHRGL